MSAAPPKYQPMTESGSAKSKSLMFPPARSCGVITSFIMTRTSPFTCSTVYLACLAYCFVVIPSTVAAFLLPACETVNDPGIPHFPRLPVKFLQIPCLLPRVNWRGTAFLGTSSFRLGGDQRPVTSRGEFFLDLGGLCGEPADAVRRASHTLFSNRLSPGESGCQGLGVIQTLGRWMKTTEQVDRYRTTNRPTLPFASALSVRRRTPPDSLG